jgi:hypothetical protein
MSGWSSKVNKPGSGGGASPAAKKDEPPKQPDFQIGSVDFIKIGTVAVFGLDDVDLILSVSEKLNRVSSMYGELVVSRMGEEVPLPDSYDVHTGNEWPLKLEYREKLVLDKVFCIVYMQGLDEEGERVFAYVNVRCDRLDNLHEKMFAGPTFNLPDNSTVVITGQGTPTAEDREKLQRDYLFGERHTNVRIFPPLSEVT